jgi:hypothetical protein
MESLLNIDILYFIIKKCTSDWRLDDREPYYTFTVVLDGNAQYIINETSLELTTGQAMLLSPGTRRQATTKNGMFCMALDFRLRTGSLSLSRIHNYEPTEQLHSLIRDIEYTWLQREDGYREKCGALFVLLLQVIFIGKSVVDTTGYTEKIKRYILRYLSEPLTVERAAFAVGLTPDYCGTLFSMCQV